MDNLPTGAIEIATIALTENDANEEIFGPTAQSFKDDDLPEILLKVCFRTHQFITCFST